MHPALMLQSWIFWTLLATVMQSVRTAAQRSLRQAVNAETATLARYLFALPFAFFWLGLLLMGGERSLPAPPAVFWVYGAAAGLLQILATVLLIELLTLRNFAVGNTWVRGEVILTALLGVLFFGAGFSLFSWLGMLVCVTGLLLISAEGRGWSRQDFFSRSAAYGFSAGLAFAFTALFIREASLSFALQDPLFTAALTLNYMICLQTLVLLVYVGLRFPEQLRGLFRHSGSGWFIGLTSMLGSTGWFTAMTLMEPALVKAVGQIEVGLALIISWFFFRERPNRREIIGMLLVVAGVLGLLLFN